MVVEDIKACKGNTKGLIFILCFRISQFFTKNTFLKIIGFPIRLFYKVVFECIYGIEIKDTTKIGVGFNVYHGYSIVIERYSVIGNYVTIRQNTTIGSGSFDGSGKSPVIGNNVQIAPHCIIIGDVHVGNNACIGAGSVVVKDVLENVVVVGNPAKFIKYNDKNTIV